MSRVRKLLSRTSLKLALLLVLLFFGSIIVWFFWQGRQNKQAESEPLITYSVDFPDESKDNAISYQWRGAPEEPKKIRITKINVDAYIQKAGVDQNKRVAVPNNVHLAAWFADSVKPGQKGLSIIDGHVSGRQTEGVFEQIGKLSAGDEVEIEMGNGTIKKYKVIESQQIKESEAVSVLFDQSPKVVSQLNLITCGGRFDRSTNQYEDRIIVSTELIN